MAIEDEEEQDRLYNAYINNEYDLMIYLLDNGADPNTKYDLVTTLLEHAVRQISMDLVSKYGKNKIKSIEILLKYGADTRHVLEEFSRYYNGSGNINYTLLVLKLLLDYGADPNYPKDILYTIYRNQYIDTNKKYKIMNLLLDYGSSLKYILKEIPLKYHRYNKQFMRLFIKYSSSFVNVIHENKNIPEDIWKLTYEYL